MKKFMSLALASIMLLSVGACGSSSQTDSQSSSQEVESSQATEAAAESASADSASTETSEAPADAAAAGSEEAGSLKGKRLGIITPNATHGFTAESIQHAEAEAKQLSEKYGFDYNFMTANEASEQSNNVDTILGMNPDCIVLWPITGDELRSSAQKVMDAGIPLIIYDRLIDNFTPTTWIMGDNETIGKDTGTYFNEYFATELAAGEVNILEFKGDSSTVPMQRSEGFMSTANENFNIVQAFDTGWQRQTSMEHMESFLNTRSKEEIESIQAIFTHDDEIVLGVMDAIKNYSGPATLNIRLISGVGGRRENVELFKDTGIEGIDLVTFTFSPSMVREAIVKGVEAMQGKTLEDHYILPTQMVDKDNVDEYMASEEYTVRYSLSD